MIFEWMSDPAAWVGLLTLVVLEIVWALITWFLLPFWRRNFRQSNVIRRVLLA